MHRDDLRPACVDCISAGADCQSAGLPAGGRQAASGPRDPVIVPEADHVDLHEDVKKTPFDRLEALFKQNLVLGGLAADGPRPSQDATASQEQNQARMIIGGVHRFAIALEDNPTARAFAQMLPLTLDMPDLNDNEKHVRLPRSLPTDAARPGTIRTGDVMPYGSNTLVVFYKTFPSSYSYTRIGRVTQVDGLVEALGPGSQRIEFRRD